jgi:hypothetical protein
MTATTTPSAVRRAVPIAVLVLVAVAGIAAYVVAAMLSDGRSYSKSSLDYLILTPAILRSLPLGQAEDMRFTYSAADGPKPVVSTVEFVITGDQDRFTEAIREDLRSKGLTEKSPGVFERSGQEVSLLPASADAPRMRIEVLEYLD